MDSLPAWFPKNNFTSIDYDKRKPEIKKSDLPKTIFFPVSQLLRIQQ